MSISKGSGRAGLAASPSVVQTPEDDGISTRSAAKRRNILGAALDLFATHGFGRTGMRSLAAEAGVSTATIYANFPTKQHLLRALIQERWQQALTTMLSRASGVDDPLERLLVAVTDLNHAISADPLLRRLLVTPRSVGDAQIEKRVVPMEEMLDERCTDAIREAVKAGRLECADPEALAVLIRVSMQGWLLRDAKRRKPMSEERVTRALVALMRAAQPKKRR